MVASKLTALLLATVASVFAQATCPNTIAWPARQPFIAPGYNVRILARDVGTPRELVFDTEGNLLFISDSMGIVSMTLKDEGNGCISVASKKNLIETPLVTHSIALSEDGKTLYVTTIEALIAFDYDAKTQTLGATNRTLVNGMTGTDHISRTMLWSKKVPGTVLINRGSFENVDLEAAKKESGHSNIRSFDLSNPGSTPITWLDGKQVSWGTRNSVGIAEHPVTGGIWSVENSVDNIQRDGKDIHERNPAEEMNFHGYLNGTVHPNYGGNFGYPYCYTVWNVTEIPRNTGFDTGSVFAMDADDKTYDDNFCKTQTIAPRISFPAHWAPLDIKFNPAGDTAWVTAHGSWNRDEASGYLLFHMAFDPKTGEPLAKSNARDHINSIWENGYVNDCPADCFRPTSMAWDSKGRLFVSSDSSGELFVVTKTDGSGLADIKSAYPATIRAPLNSGIETSGAAVAQGGIAGASLSRRAIVGAAVGAYGFSM